MTEYALMPVNVSPSSNVSLSVTGTDIIGVVGPPSPSLMPTDALLFADSEPSTRRSDVFQNQLREWERRNLFPSPQRVSRAPGQPMIAAGGDLQSITPGVPALGDLMDLNVAQGCTGTPDLRTGRVRSIGTHVIVIADTMNPAGGFTTAQYDSIRMEIDTIAYPAVAGNFGNPSDIDGNGRIVVFYTRAVNELIPPGSSTTIDFGYTAARDLYDSVVCPQSNVGEMIYLLVPDPTAPSTPTSGRLRLCEGIRFEQSVVTCRP